MPSHDLMRMLGWDAQGAAHSSGAQNPEALQRSLQGDHRLRLGAVLSEMGDSYFGQDWEEFVRLADQLGFALLRFTPYYLNGPAEQRLWIHSQGALLVADSYSNLVNQAKLWMCWQPHQSSGEGWPPGIHPSDLQRDYWHGGLDVHEGLQVRWQAILDSGSLLSPWPTPLRPWPFHAGEDCPQGLHAEEARMIRLLQWPPAARKIMNLL